MTQVAPLEISPAQLASWDGEAPVLLDVREPWEVEVVSLPGAMALPMGEIPARLEELPRDKPLVVFCHHGGRSLRVVQFLRQRGFDRAVNLAGGIDAYARSVDPTLAVY